MYSLENQKPSHKKVIQEPRPEEYRSEALFDLEFQLRVDSMKIVFPDMHLDEIENLITKMMHLEGWDYDTDNRLYVRYQRIV